MPVTRVLLVDDDEVICSTLSVALTESGFEVTSAYTVVQALGHITSRQYDVLLSDLHMPGAGDGLTVVSAMRHANPSAVTLLLSAFPRMAAAQAILLQADEILTGQTGKHTLARRGNTTPRGHRTLPCSRD
jgi:CheY-like chemotaxis protein